MAVSFSMEKCNRIITKKKRKKVGMLTDKQNLFIKYVLEGNTYKDAYLKAYPSSKKWQDNTLRARASGLMAREEVNNEYHRRKKELEKAHKKKLLYTKERAIADLLWIQEESKKDIKDTNIRQANSTAFLNATKELIELENLREEGDTMSENEKALSEIFDNLKDEIYK